MTRQPVSRPRIRLIHGSLHTRRDDPSARNQRTERYGYSLGPRRARAGACTSGSIAAAMPELTGPVATRPCVRRGRLGGTARADHGTDERAEQRRLWAWPGRTWSVASVNDPMPRAGSSQHHAACPGKTTAGRPAMTRGNPCTVRTAKQPRVSGQLEGQRRPRPGRRQDACLPSAPDASTRRTQQGREPSRTMARAPSRRTAKELPFPNPAPAAGRRKRTVGQQLQDAPGPS
jgi:hypothetical protein